MITAVNTLPCLVLNFSKHILRLFYLSSVHHLWSAFSKDKNIEGIECQENLMICQRTSLLNRLPVVELTHTFL